MQGMSNIMFYMDGEFNDSRTFKIHFWSRFIKPPELNLGLRKTTMLVKDNLYRRAVLVKVLSGLQSFCERSCKISQILFSTLYSTWTEILIIQEIRNILIWSRVRKLQSLESCAENSCDDYEKYRLQPGLFCKSTVWILKVSFCKIMQDY